MSEQPNERNERTWTEAPASANVRVTIGGRDWQITIRADTLKDLIPRVEWMNGWLDEHAPAPQQTYDAARNPGAGNGKPEPVYEDEDAAQYGEFDAAAIVFSIDENDKPAYKVAGANPKFPKFPVRVWPEVLPALGIDAAKLQPGRNPFVAKVRYLKNDKGNPLKVVGVAQATT